LLSSRCVLRFWLGWVAASKSSTTHSRRLMVICAARGRGGKPGSAEAPVCDRPDVVPGRQGAQHLLMPGGQAGDPL
jgi:hypothetical protein